MTGRLNLSSVGHWGVFISTGTGDISLLRYNITLIPLVLSEHLLVSPKNSFGDWACRRLEDRVGYLDADLTEYTIINLSSKASIKIPIANSSNVKALPVRRSSMGGTPPFVARVSSPRPEMYITPDSLAAVDWMTGDVLTWYLTASSQARMTHMESSTWKITSPDHQVSGLINVKSYNGRSAVETISFMDAQYWPGVGSHKAPHLRDRPIVMFV
ncbi:hypothetical protein LshimejAT787_1301920 [Lyophyllum shimeji]|uniref:Uncharacterized protein n=1 Tax=Lyophyllum shimeji TaxID=47721 RepID=A0A9P3PY50_LYOSH|nr:hypothetical protein LshimejAT787_1301920 [Lyophyllum shimeji]